MKTQILFLVLCITGVLMFNNCKKDKQDDEVVVPEQPTVIDIDGNVYHTVTINDQVWMVENLKTTHFRNGDEISKFIGSYSVWGHIYTGYCDYDNLATNGSTYGHLYNYHTINDSRKIAPSGWHVPTYTDWTTLRDYLGGQDVAGGKLKETGTSHWADPNTGATNETGFTALPGGKRAECGSFYNITEYGFWWSATATVYDTNIINIARILHNYSRLDMNWGERAEGYPVRCIKDK